MSMSSAQRRRGEARRGCVYAMMRGRIVRGVGGFYTVRDAQGEEYVLRARGRFRRERKTPLVGDEVTFTPGSGRGARLVG